MTVPEPTAESTEAVDPGMVRAGAAAAARRRELNISQRSLAADGVINAGALIAFEKGRSWPRERTRAKLEEVLRWPAGTIARIRRGEPEGGAAPPAAPPPVITDEVSLIVQAVMTAVSPLDKAIDALPGPHDPAFTPRAAAILADLRQLEGVAARAGRISTVTPALIKALSAVRTRYDDLMMRAAAAPHPTLGQRLYAARRRANLTIAETAQAAGISDGDIVSAEGEQPVAEEVADAIETLINELS
jgi:transcriptional regulator with XRE-family HTH domain